jgi:hypothetical protein
VQVLHALCIHPTRESRQAVAMLQRSSLHTLGRPVSQVSTTTKISKKMMLLSMFFSIYRSFSAENYFEE